MAQSTSATLGGVPLNFVEQGIVWSLVYGVESPERFFYLTGWRARKILKRGFAQFRSDSGAPLRTYTRQSKANASGGPLTLEIKAPGYKTMTAKGLYVLQLGAVDANRLVVAVVDRRWLLGRKHIDREYNTRRRTGDRRLVGSAMSPIQVRESLPDYGYKRVTLKNGNPWKAREVLEDVLLELVGQGGFRIGKLPLQIDIQDLDLDDTGTGALRRVLAYLPGAEVYVDYDGVLVVANRLDGSELAMLKRMPVTQNTNGIWQGLYGTGTAIKVDKSLMRPVGVESMIEMECEVRFNYRHGESDAGQRGREHRIIQNVIPVTDPEVTLRGKTIARGTFLPAEDWFTAIAALDDAPASAAAFGGKLTDDLIRGHWLSGLQLLEVAFVRWEDPAPSGLWSMRLNALRQHWRWTYRILPQWLDKIKSVKAYRVAILDQESGQRAEAQAFFDHCLKPTIRGAQRSLKGKRNEAGWIVNGFAENLADARPGPATVAVIDPDNGLIKVIPEVDPFGFASTVTPGYPDTLPTLKMASDFVLWSSPAVALRSTFNLAIVLTVTRAAPNDSSRNWIEVGTPADAVKILPGVTSVGRCGAPKWTMKVGPNVQTARFAWLDAFASQIESAWFDGKPYPRSLLVNGVMVKDIAKANAARIYSYLLDRIEGRVTTSLDPTVKPTGSMVGIHHIVTKKGAAFTTASMPPVVMPPDLFALLPDSARKIIQRRVET